MGDLRTLPVAGWRRNLRWLVACCALAGFVVATPTSTDLTLFVCGTIPVLPAEEDETAPLSEGASMIGAAHARREPGQPRRERQPLLRPNAHTPSNGFETADFRPPPDHFRNGLGTPPRC